MKRFSVVILAMMFMLCGCGKKNDVNLRTDLLSFVCNIDYGGKNYSFDVKALEGGIMDCEVTSPDTLAGMRCLVNEESVKIEYKDIKTELKLSDIPFGSAISLFYAVMKDGKDRPLSENDGEFSLSGTVNGIDYKLIATDGGLPISVAFESEKIFMEFTDLALVKQ